MDYEILIPRQCDAEQAAILFTEVKQWLEKRYRVRFTSTIQDDSSCVLKPSNTQFPTFSVLQRGEYGWRLSERLSDYVPDQIWLWPGVKSSDFLPDLKYFVSAERGVPVVQETLRLFADGEMVSQVVEPEQVDASAGDKRWRENAPNNISILF